MLATAHNLKQRIQAMQNPSSQYRQQAEAFKRALYSKTKPALDELHQANLQLTLKQARNEMIELLDQTAMFKDIGAPITEDMLKRQRKILALLVESSWRATPHVQS